MTRIYVFGDEAGDFNFSRNPGATRYFLLTTVTLTDCAVGGELLDLRRELAWDGHNLTQGFHATEDRQLVRDRVYAVLEGHGFRIDATIFDKARAYPAVYDDARFYTLAWFLHVRRLIPRIAALEDEVLLVAASLGTRKRHSIFHTAVNEAMARVIPGPSYQTQFWPADVDPCLQVADYCSWALQRKWERGDSRSYVLIENKIASEHDAFAGHPTTYY